MTEFQFKKELVTVHHSGEEIPDRIPTISIKKSTRNATASIDTVRSSYIPTQGQVGLLTYFHLFSSGKGSSTLALVDRNGTFDRFIIGTAVEVGNKEVTLQGDWKKPIHVIRGSFNVYNVGGSIGGTGESISHSWEVVKI